MRLLLFDIDGTLVLTGGAGSRAMTRAFAETHGLEDALQKVDLAGRTDRIIMRDALTHAGRIRRRRPGRSRSLPRGLLRRAARGDPAAGQRTPRPAARCPPAARGPRRPRRRPAGAAHRQLPRLGRDQAGGLRRVALLLVGRVRRRRHRARRPDRGRARAARDRTRALIEPDAVVVIGDTPHDIRCARAGGAKAVAVATGNYDLEALRGHQPDALFADLTDTDAVLEVLLR